MKKLLVILLLIPSLSWAKVVALDCQRSDPYISEKINETYILDLKRKTVENILSDGSTIRNTSILEITNSLIKFKAEGWSTYGVGGLNRYSLELKITDRYDNDGNKMSMDIFYQCKILEKQF